MERNINNIFLLEEYAEHLSDDDLDRLLEQSKRISGGLVIYPTDLWSEKVFRSLKKSIYNKNK